MEDKYLQDIQEIKKMMSRSTQFISLSGISGILAGIYALVGAFLAYQTIYFDVQITESSYKHLVISYSAIQKLWLIAASVLVASVITGILLSYRKATKTNDSIWNPTARRLVINFSIPLFAGGIFIFSLIQREVYGLIAPLTLIFYGMACLNASKYTLGSIRSLGISMIIIGLISSFFIGYGLLLWAIGFGFCHIIYGTIMYFKYDK